MQLALQRLRSYQHEFLLSVTTADTINGMHSSTRPLYVDHSGYGLQPQ